MFDDLTPTSFNETDDDPCPSYASVGGVTGVVGGDHHHQEQLSDALVGLDEAIADLDALLGHLGDGTVEGTADLLSVSNKAAVSSEDVCLPSYADTRMPSFIHLSTTSATTGAISTTVAPTSTTAADATSTIVAPISTTDSDPDLDREVCNFTTNANPGNPTETSSAGRPLGARPRDSNPLSRSNAFRSPADNMDIHLRTHRAGWPTTHEGGSTMSGLDGDSHQFLANPSHTFCPVLASPLQRSHGCAHLPTCVVSPMPLPAPRFSRSLVAISAAAAADPALLIQATVVASQESPPPAPHQPPISSPPVLDGTLQFPMNMTESAEETQGGEESAEETQGGARAIEMPNESSGAVGSASVWTPTTDVSGITFGAVSGCTKTKQTLHIISYHIICSSYVLGCEICLLSLHGFRFIT